jgi:type IV secretion system protein VirB8
MTTAPSAPADVALPRSKNALKAIAEANSWEMSTQEARAESAARAWKITGAAVALALMGWGMALYQSSRPLPAPATIVVDRITGDTMVVSRFDENSVPQISAVDQHWAAIYVRARESYYFNLLKRDYDQVARMSTPEVFAPYSSPFMGDTAMQTKVGTTQEHRVTLVSVRMSTTTKPGRSGEAIVTFDKEIKSNQGTPPTTTRYVATVRFEYRPKAMKEAVDRIENPFGFVVLSYRAEPELLTPGPAPAPTGGNTSTSSSS